MGPLLMRRSATTPNLAHSSGRTSQPFSSGISISSISRAPPRPSPSSNDNSFSLRQTLESSEDPSPAEVARSQARPSPQSAPIVSPPLVPGLEDPSWLTEHSRYAARDFLHRVYADLRQSCTFCFMYYLQPGTGHPYPG